MTPARQDAWIKYYLGFIDRELVLPFHFCESIFVMSGGWRRKPNSAKQRSATMMPANLGGCFHHGWLVAAAYLTVTC
jgi:hypothetical protein